jgi:hypothetical protein
LVRQPASFPHRHCQMGIYYQCTQTKIPYSVDISDASRQDLKPRFPHPTKMLQDAKESANNLEISALSIRPLQPWRQWFDDSQVLETAFDGLSMAVQYTKSRGAQNQIWRQVIHGIDPIMHRLLNMDSNVNQHDSSSVIKKLADSELFCSWRRFGGSVE